MGYLIAPDKFKGALEPMESVRHSSRCRTRAFAGRVDPGARPLLLEHFDEITALADGTVSAAEAIRRAPELLRARAAELAPRWGALLSG
jgi:hypothetical protein